MLTVAILVTEDSPLPAGTPVDWIGSGSGATGHMVAVVNRDPQSVPADADTWGDHYLIVDYWYALQAGVAPLFLPGKKSAVADKEKVARDAHDTYRVFFDNQGTASLKGVFTARAYKPFKIKSAEQSGTA